MLDSLFISQNHCEGEDAATQQTRHSIPRASCAKNASCKCNQVLDGIGNELIHGYLFGIVDSCADDAEEARLFRDMSLFDFLQGQPDRLQIRQRTLAEQRKMLARVKSRVSFEAEDANFKRKKRFMINKLVVMNGGGGERAAVLDQSNCSDETFLLENKLAAVNIVFDKTAFMGGIGESPSLLDLWNTGQATNDHLVADDEDLLVADDDDEDIVASDDPSFARRVAISKRIRTFLELCARRARGIKQSENSIKLDLFALVLFIDKTLGHYMRCNNNNSKRKRPTTEAMIEMISKVASRDSAEYIVQISILRWIEERCEHLRNTWPADQLRGQHLPLGVVKKKKKKKKKKKQFFFFCSHPIFSRQRI